MLFYLLTYQAPFLNFNVEDVQSSYRNFNTRRTEGVIFDPWDILVAVHIFGTASNEILKFQDFT